MGVRHNRPNINTNSNNIKKMSIKKPKYVPSQGGAGVPEPNNNVNYFAWAVGIIIFILALSFIYYKFV